MITKEEGYYQELNILFGELNAPAYVKEDEINNKNTKNEEFILTSSKDFQDIYVNYFYVNHVGQEKVPIWVITKEGTLKTGSDHGHTALTKVSSARVGGDISLIKSSEEKPTYEIKSKSGRYSSQYSKENIESYMQNVLLKFQATFPSNSFKITKDNK